MQLKINAAQTKERRERMKKKRNEKLRGLHHKIQQKEEEKLIKNIEDIENSKDDSNKMNKAVRNINRNKSKEPILVEGNNGLITNEEKASEIVTDFFKKIFNQEKQTQIPDIKPKQMKIPFTKDEIEKAIKSLKNEKSAGIDNITAEQLKNVPPGNL